MNRRCTGWMALLCAAVTAMAQEPAEKSAPKENPAAGQSAPASGQAAPVAQPAPVADELGQQITQKVQTILEKGRSAICRVEGNDEHGPVRGTGFFVDADGTLITSYSLGGLCEDLVVTIGEERFPASRRAADSRSGLAVLKVNKGEPVPFLRFGNSRNLVVGSPVVSLGYPLEFPLSPSLGLVGGFDMCYKSRCFNARHIRANVSAQQGQSGSPVFNLSGEAIGVLISTVENGSGAFVLPIEVVDKILHDLQQHGRIRQGWLGTHVRETEAPEFGSRARIRALKTEGPGYQGGLRAGDVLLQIGDRKIVTPADVLDASLYTTAGEPVKVEIARAGRKQELMLTPGDIPAGETPRLYPDDEANSTLKLGKPDQP